MAAYIGCRFVLSHGTRVDTQIAASLSEEFPLLLPYKQHGRK